MLAINCPSCPHLIVLQNDSDRAPPWCPRCGADLKPHAVPTLPDAARKLWNEAPAAADAITPTPTVAALQVETPPVVLPAEPLPQRPGRADSFLAPEPVSGPRAVTPPWAMLFAVLCGIIPLMTLGGAIPAAIGFGGASGCLSVARNNQMDTTARITLCSAITIGCWVAVFAILGGLMMLF